MGEFYQCFPMLTEQHPAVVSLSGHTVIAGLCERLGPWKSRLLRSGRSEGASAPGGCATLGLPGAGPRVRAERRGGGGGGGGEAQGVLRRTLLHRHGDGQAHRSAAAHRGHGSGRGTWPLRRAFLQEHTHTYLHR